MKKLLLSLATVFCMGFASQAADVSFDFVNEDYGMMRYSGSDSEYPAVPIDLIQDGVTVTFSGDASSWRLWTDGFRAYRNKNAKFTVTAPEGGEITSVSWTVKNGGTFALAGTTETITNWEGSENSVTFDYTATTNNYALFTLNISYEGGSDTPQEPVDFNDFTANPTYIPIEGFYGMTFEWKYPVQILDYSKIYVETTYFERLTGENGLIVTAEGNKLIINAANPPVLNPYRILDFTFAGVFDGGITVNGQVLETPEEMEGIRTELTWEPAAGLAVPDPTFTPKQGYNAAPTIDEIKINWDGFWVGYSNNYNSWSELEDVIKIYKEELDNWNYTYENPIDVKISYEGAFSIHADRWQNTLILTPAQTLSDPNAMYVLVIPSGSLGFKEKESGDNVDIYEVSIDAIFTVTGAGNISVSPRQFQNINVADWKGFVVENASAAGVALLDASKVVLYDKYLGNSTEIKNATPVASGIAGSSEGDNIVITFGDYEFYNGTYTIIVNDGAFSGLPTSYDSSNPLYMEGINGNLGVRFTINGRPVDIDTIEVYADPAQDKSQESINYVRVWWGDYLQLQDPNNLSAGDDETENLVIQGGMSFNNGDDQLIDWTIVKEGKNADASGDVVEYNYYLQYTPAEPLTAEGKYAFKVYKGSVQVYVNSQNQLRNNAVDLYYTIGSSSIEPAPVPDQLYLIGNVTGWDPAQGMAMEMVEEGVFTIENVQMPDYQDGYSYFAFTAELGDWDVINANRVSPESDGDLFDPEGQNPFVWANDAAWMIEAGTYNFFVNFNTGYVTSTVGSTTTPSVLPAPTAEPADKSEINYPSVNLTWNTEIALAKAMAYAQVSYNEGEARDIELLLLTEEGSLDSEGNYTPGPAYGINVDWYSMIFGEDYQQLNGLYTVTIPAGTICSAANPEAVNEDIVLNYYLVQAYGSETVIPAYGSDYIYNFAQLADVTIAWNGKPSFELTGNGRIMVGTVVDTGESEEFNAEPLAPEYIKVNETEGTIVLNLSHLTPGRWVVEIPVGYVKFDEFTVNSALTLVYNVTDGIGTAQVLQPTSEVTSVAVPVNLTWNYQTIYPTMKGLSATLSFWANDEFKSVEVPADAFTFHTITVPGDEEGGVDQSPADTPVPAAEGEGNMLSIDIVSLLEGVEGYITLSIPEGIVKNSDDKENSAQEITLQIIPLYDGAASVAYSEANNTLTITWKDAEELYIVGGPALIEGDDNEVYQLIEYQNINLSATWDALVVNLPAGLDGNYTLVIPEGYVNFYGTINAEINYQFNFTDGKFGEGHVNGGGTEIPGGGDEPGDEPGDNPGGDEPGDNPSGVSSLEAEAAQNGVYNLNGVKVGNSLNGLTPGLYIINGQKVILK